MLAGSILAYGYWYGKIGRARPTCRIHIWENGLGCVCENPTLYLYNFRANPIGVYIAWHPYAG